MVHRGPAQKSVKHGRTANADWTEVPDVPFPGPSPDLPRLPRRAKWHPMVEQWWEQVREMPHCRLWRPVDWTFALETAFMKQTFWTDVEAQAATTSAAVEIRRREAQMGTTMEALRQLRIRYAPVAGGDADVDPDTTVVVQQHPAGDATVATVTPLADRRARLTRSA